MPEFYLLHFDDIVVAVSQQGLTLRHDVGDIHQLPFLPPDVVGVLIAEEHKTALVDLALFLGGHPYQNHQSGQILLLSDATAESGFVINADVTKLSLEDDAVIPLPGGLARPEMQSCVVVDGQQAIPLVDLYALTRQGDNLQFPLAADKSLLFDRKEPAGVAELRLFKIGSEIFALPLSSKGARSFQYDRLNLLPLAPSYIKGLCGFDGGAVVVVDLAQKLGFSCMDESRLVLASESVGVRGEEDLGPIAIEDFQWRLMPPLLDCPWLLGLISHHDQIVPVLDPVGLFDPAGDGDGPPLAERYRPDSSFASCFGEEEVEVLEFILLGVRHALPKAEVADVVDMLPLHSISGLPSLAIGVVDYKGEAIAVLDLAMAFARRSLIASHWQLILVGNGDFRAFVVSEKVFAERTLAVDVQYQVPIPSTLKLVYGCYPCDDAVSLIFNIEALALNFNMAVVKEIIPTLTEKMAESPAEIIVELLPVDILDHVQIQKENEEDKKRQRQIAEQQRAQDEAARRREENEQHRLKVEAEARLKRQERRKVEEAVMLEGEERRLEELQQQADLVQAEAELQFLADKRQLAEAAEARRFIHEAEETYWQQAIRRYRQWVVLFLVVITIIYFATGDKVEQGQDRREGSQEQHSLALQKNQSATTSSPDEKSEQLEQVSVLESEIGVTQEDATKPEEVSQILTLEESSALDSGNLDNEHWIVGEDVGEGADVEQADQSILDGEMGEDGKGDDDVYEGGVMGSSDSLPTTSDLVVGDEAGMASSPPPVVMMVGEEVGVGALDDTGSEVMTENDKDEREDKVNDEPLPIPQVLIVTVPDDMVILHETYMVKKGDTLWDISSELTGDPYNFVEMARENKIKNPNMIFPKQTIQLKKLGANQSGQTDQ